MTGWLLLGGCVLGLLGVERVQRILFPGEPLPWGWRWGRTRRQEEPTGGGPGSRAAPSSEISFDRILPSFSRWVRRLETEPPMEVEEALRKRLFETRDREQRILLTGLLAQASLLLDNRTEAHHLIEEAEENLRSAWSGASPVFRRIAEHLCHIKALIHHQEGEVPVLLDLLCKGEAMFGGRPWISMMRAEAHLLAGEVEECQSVLLACLRNPRSGKNGNGALDLPTGAWAVLGESYLRLRDWERLDQVLAVCVGLKRIGTEDRAATARLKVELMLRDGLIREAWRAAGEIHAMCEKEPTHRGLARAFHLTCARIHLYEANAAESLRRLQMAENESRYPVAVWEVDFLRAVVLETENRHEEAFEVWRNLAEKSPYTYLGRVASNRILERNEPTENRSSRTVAAPSPSV